MRKLPLVILTLCIVFVGCATTKDDKRGKCSCICDCDGLKCEAQCGLEVDEDKKIRIAP